MKLTGIIACAAIVQAHMFGDFFNQMLKKEFTVEESWHNQEYHRGECHSEGRKDTYVVTNTYTAPLTQSHVKDMFAQILLHVSRLQLTVPASSPLQKSSVCTPTIPATCAFPSRETATTSQTPVPRPLMDSEIALG